MSLLFTIASFLLALYIGIFVAGLVFNIIAMLTLGPFAAISCLVDWWHGRPKAQPRLDPDKLAYYRRKYSK